MLPSPKRNTWMIDFAEHTCRYRKIIDFFLFIAFFKFNHYVVL
jgi:hypothetical protein